MIYPEIVLEGLFPAKWVELTDEEYHSDLTAQNATSLAHILKSPFSYLSHRNNPKEPTDDMLFGTYVHLASLQEDVFKEKILVEQTFKGTGSKAAREAWEAGIPKDKIILSQKVLDTIHAMKKSLLEHEEIAFLLDDSVKERVGYFRDPLTGILCRFKPDFIHSGLVKIGDLKTTRDCTESVFSKTILERNYHLQAYFYQLGTELITGVKMEPVWAVIEKTPPYEVALYRPHADVMEKAKRDYERAMLTLKDCIQRNYWPRYQRQNQVINLPAWAYYEE
jgi:Fe-S cluster biosynthesis and repair protein YggX